MNSPDERCLEIEESIEFSIDVVRLTSLLLLLLLFLLLQKQLFLLLTLQELLKLQAPTARLVLIGRFDKFQLRSFMSPPEVRGRQQDEKQDDDAEGGEDTNQYYAT